MNFSRGAFMKKFFVQSSWSRKAIGSMLIMALAVVGCDDSSSASAEPNDEPGVESSSSVGGVNCSELLEGETGWSWDVPKECRFNPDIDYGTMTDSRDGKVYRTVKIGDQTWMAENLNFDLGQGGSGENKYDWSWCYGDEPEKCDVAGRLYTWAAAMDSVGAWSTNGKGCGDNKTCTPTYPVRGVCPEGWHLPSKAEWLDLFDAVGGQSTAGKLLKSQTGWYDNGNDTDAFGFSALPAGRRNYGGFFDYDGYYANFWCSTENGGYYAYGMALFFDDDGGGLGKFYTDYGFSVRCVKNN